VAAFGIAFLLVGSSSNVQAKTVGSCNGYAQLCNRRLDEVVFAGTPQLDVGGRHSRW